mmetsp:Transcript_12832/g.21399  ORF Transcript_12832/g.21399 Transcript_12832/m.21399 type:complete len:85 (-) Transcript_12832:635-889(-)
MKSLAWQFTVALWTRLHHHIPHIPQFWSQQQQQQQYQAPSALSQCSSMPNDVMIHGILSQMSSSVRPSSYPQTLKETLLLAESG